MVSSCRYRFVTAWFPAEPLSRLWRKTFSRPNINSQWPELNNMFRTVLSFVFRSTTCSWLVDTDYRVLRAAHLLQAIQHKSTKNIGVKGRYLQFCWEIYSHVEKVTECVSVESISSRYPEGIEGKDYNEVFSLVVQQPSTSLPLPACGWAGSELQDDTPYNEVFSLVVQQPSTSLPLPACGWAGSELQDDTPVQSRSAFNNRLLHYRYRPAVGLAVSYKTILLSSPFNNRLLHYRYRPAVGLAVSYKTILLSSPFNNRLLHYRYRPAVGLAVSYKTILLSIPFNNRLLHYRYRPAVGLAVSYKTILLSSPFNNRLLCYSYRPAVGLAVSYKTILLSSPFNNRLLRYSYRPAVGLAVSYKTILLSSPFNNRLLHYRYRPAVGLAVSYKTILLSSPFNNRLLHYRYRPAVGRFKRRLLQTNGFLGMLQVREVREKSGEKTGLEIREKSGNPVSGQGKVREFRRWSGKNIKSLYTNKLTAAAPSPSLQTTRRMKQAAIVQYMGIWAAARLAYPLIAKNPGDCVEKSRGKMKNLVWKSGKSQGISLLDFCSNPDFN
ncbi:hypothetical protein J6590_037938 [Homalodisca vitripennis]|nr:hypothetical protein J6590_037938 [Homalodisca vitripennis]